ncbi:MAG: hypothetical protein P4L59_14740 [Desulfosporosinus sp.]|nr:hypothetical protein [Desulfosporosinus sp.]
MHVAPLERCGAVGLGCMDASRTSGWMDGCGRSGDVRAMETWGGF